MIEVVAVAAFVAYVGSLFWLVVASCGGVRNAFSLHSVGTVSLSSISMRQVSVAAFSAGLTGSAGFALITYDPGRDSLSSLLVRWLIGAVVLTAVSFLSAAFMTSRMSSTAG